MKRLQPQRPIRRGMHIPDVAVLGPHSDRAPALVPMQSKEVFLERIMPALPPPGVVPRKQMKMAMDDASWNPGFQSWMVNSFYNYAFVEGYTFMGYPFLSQLAQIPEYRLITETVAEESTRKWIEVKSVSDDEGKSDRIKQLEFEMKRLRVRDRFKKASVHDGFMGRAHIYIDTGDTADRDELMKPMGAIKAAQKKYKPGFIKAFRNVEPIWTYPSRYNASDPLSNEWYNPQKWFVNGKEVDASRLLTFVGREVPDIFKPAFSFGGLSLSQMSKPYVDNWLNVRQSVTDLLLAFSTMVLATDLSTLMQADGVELKKRIGLYNTYRRNNGVMVISKNDEDLTNVAAPLGGLHELQAQAQEHMATPAQIPLVKLFGIQPTGLNANSDGEIRVFYDRQHSYQHSFYDEQLELVFQLCQLNLWGEIDEDLVYLWKPLWELDDEALANVKKVLAETDGMLIDKNVLNPRESRQRLADDPDQDYGLLDVDDTPEPDMPLQENIKETDKVQEEGSEGESKKAAPAKAAVGGSDHVSDVRGDS